ncbi:MAG: RidA family protein [Peptococcaceae bacterium]|jgi:enamine deaminase RidA (YjgF/YER057c/UK114 family)|nr:RidA family protein [Peptococcaceae bacterium]
MTIEEKLREMGVSLPAAPAPLASYVPAVTAGQLVFTSGQVPLANGQLGWKGKVGRDVDAEGGYQAARQCAVNCLAVIKAVAGSLDHVGRIVKVTGFVSSAPGFNDQAKVVNGASDFLLELFGDAGRHARAAVGVSELPLDAPVEVEMVVQLRD